MGTLVNIRSDGGELGRALADLAQLLPRAADAMAEIRDRLAACWPTRPGMGALAPTERAVFESGMRLVEASRWKQGELYLAIEAASNTLDAHEREPSDRPALEMWGLGRVDPAAQLVPAPSAGDALRDAIPAAEHVRDTIHRRLDEIAQLAPPEGWLPEWNVEDAGAYTAAAKWRHARPPQPPHEYTVRGWQPKRRQDFLAFAQLIQASGVLKTGGTMSTRTWRSMASSTGRWAPG